MNQSLWLYFLLVLGIVALPGMDMAYVVSCALAGGARRAAAAISGIVSGGAVHVLTATVGITAVVASYPRALRAFALVGSGYMAWMGIQLLRSRPSAPAADSLQGGQGSAFRYGVVTCLVNPKAYAFTLAVLPSFLRLQGSALAFRAAQLSGITAATQVAVYGTAACVALQIHGRLGPGPNSQLWMQRTVGAIMVASSALLAFGWR